MSILDKVLKIAALGLGLVAIVHGILHMILFIYLHQLHICKANPINGVFFTYVNYFYDPACGNLSEIFAPLKPLDEIDCDASENKPCSITDAAALLLDKLDFGNLSNRASEIHNIVKLYIAFDVFWIICSVIMVVGMWFDMSPMRTAMVYIPWEVMTLILLLTDCGCSIKFYKHIRRSNYLYTWMDYVGIKWRNLGDLSKRLGDLPAKGGTGLILIFSRYGAFMVLNSLSMVVIGCIAFREFRRASGI